MDVSESTRMFKVPMKTLESRRNCSRHPESKVGVSTLLGCSGGKITLLKGDEGIEFDSMETNEPFCVESDQNRCSFFYFQPKKD